MPTRDDLVTLVILEAMALRRCVLASDPGPMTETLTHGRDALLSPVDDYRALAENIARIRDDRALAGRLGDAAFAAFERRHGLDAHVAAMERALEDAAGR